MRIIFGMMPLLILMSFAEGPQAKAFDLLQKPSHEKVDDVVIPDFSYKPARDGDISVTIDQFVSPRDAGFLPGDKNWLQVHMIVENHGPRMVTMEAIKEKLPGGRVISGPVELSELMKPPKATTEAAKDMGVLGATMGGMMLFPPAALVGGAYYVMRGPMQMDRTRKAMERLSSQSLKFESLAPSTSSDGYVYVPLMPAQQGMFLFYKVAGNETALYIPRVSPPPTPPDVAPGRHK